MSATMVCPSHLQSPPPPTSRRPSYPSKAQASNTPFNTRAADHIGGHIRGSQNVPSRTLDAMLPTLVRQLQDKETVVFHCALSQQRGPAAALRYLRERERVVAAAQSKATKAAAPAAATAGEEGSAGKVEGEEVKEQKVYVLDRGFVGWQEEYGTDERLTEGYRKELWEDGYWG